MSEELTTRMALRDLVDRYGTDRPATGITYCLAHHVGDGGEPSRNRVDSIRYLDDYALGDDGWRFVRRRLGFDWTEIRTVVV